MNGVLVNREMDMILSKINGESSLKGGQVNETIDEMYGGRYSNKTSPKKHSNTVGKALSNGPMFGNLNARTSYKQ